MCYNRDGDNTLCIALPYRYENKINVNIYSVYFDEHVQPWMIATADNMIYLLWLKYSFTTVNVHTYRLIIYRYIWSGDEDRVIAPQTMPHPMPLLLWPLTSALPLITPWHLRGVISGRAEVLGSWNVVMYHRHEGDEGYKICKTRRVTEEWYTLYVGIIYK